VTDPRPISHSTVATQAANFNEVACQRRFFFFTNFQFFRATFNHPRG